MEGWRKYNIEKIEEAWYNKDAMTSDFSLSFSSRAAEYAKARPVYPVSLYCELSLKVSGHALAWDVGTGSGQAAVGLVEFFDRVIATDASSEQIAHAKAQPRVEYRNSPAESAGIESHSVNLVTAACAVHWFNLPAFYAEVKRVLAPGGVIALWTYFYPETGGTEDRTIQRYYCELLGPLLPVGQNYYMRFYKDLPLPFEEQSPPTSEMCVDWNCEQLLAFMGTYSTRPRYAELHKKDPLDLIRD